MESNFVARGKAMFQLRQRLKQAGVDVPGDSASDPSDDPDLVPETAERDKDRPLHEGKSEVGNRALRATFGRCRTHNEQLLVRPCGIILSRATFYGSEAISAVKVFLKAEFP